RPAGSSPAADQYDSWLPDKGEDFPAQSLSLGFATGHDAGRGRDDGDAEPAEDARHLGLARVDAQARLADASQARHRRDLAADVLHLDHELAEAHAAQSELHHVGPRPAAHLAAVVPPHLELRRAL